MSSSINAPDQKIAKSMLFDLGLVPVKLSTEEPQDSWQNFKNLWNKNFNKKITLQDQLVFNRQFQTIYAMGVPLLKGLAIIEEQFEKGPFKAALKKIIIDVRDGVSLEKAFSRHPQIFNPTYVSLLRVGEASGKLDQILDRISVLTEKNVENRERVKSATFYPKIVAVVFCMVFVVVVFFIIPKIKTIYDQFSGQLPWITRAVVGFSDLLMHNFLWVFLFAGGAFYGVKRYLSTELGRLKWHRLQLKLPVFGILIQEVETLSFCSILELLAASGLPIIESLKLTLEALHNQIFKNEVQKFLKDVEQGSHLSQGLRQSTVFPKMVGDLVSVGEEVGALEMALNRISAYFNLKVTYRMDNLSKALEPLLLFIIFGAVLVLALSVFLPLWRMSSLIKR